MVYEKPISVRFDAATKTRLKKMSVRSGLSPADLIRLATETYLDDVDATGEIKIHVDRDSGPGRYDSKTRKRKSAS